MKIPTKKLKNGFEIPVYGIGTWQMGGRHTRDFQNNDRADIAAIKAAITLGVTHIDTAEMYAAGHAEELINAAIKDFDRSRLFIVSKVSQTNLRYKDVIKAAKASLKRLGTSYLDLYLIHIPNKEIPVEETMQAMDFLIDRGLIKHIGVSNFSIKKLEEAQKYAQNRIVVNQVHYNLVIREVEKKGVLKYCQEHDIMIVGYRPLEKGILAETGNKILMEMVQKYSKTPAQVAINWLISQDNVVTISKTTTLDHLKENLGVVGWEMDKTDVERLKREFPNQREVSNINPLE